MISLNAWIHYTDHQRAVNALKPPGGYLEKQGQGCFDVNKILKGHAMIRKNVLNSFHTNVSEFISYTVCIGCSIICNPLVVHLKVKWQLP